MKYSTILLSFCILSFAQAAQTTKELKATAVLNRTCTLSVENVDFSQYNPSSPVDLTSKQSINLLCSRGTTWKIYTGSKDIYDNNQYSAMLYNSYRLLYQTQLLDGIWENDTYRNGALGTSYTFNGTGTGSNQTVNINYRVIKGQYLPPGKYVDTGTAYIVF